MSIILLNVLVPRVRMGPFSLDVAGIALGGGVSLQSILEPLCVRAAQPLTEGAESWTCFPLGLPPDAGVDVPLMGSRVGFYNRRGLLEISVPPPGTEYLLSSWRPWLVDGPRSQGGADVCTFEVRPDLRGEIRVLTHSVQIRAGEDPNLINRLVRRIPAYP